MLQAAQLHRQGLASPSEPRWFHHTLQVQDMQLWDLLFTLLALCSLWSDCSLLGPYPAFHHENVYAVPLTVVSRQFVF